METFDVVVVGGGVIGCSIAFELAAEKLKVLVLDRGEPGREASWAAAGMLSPAPHSTQDIPLVPLARESLRIYAEFVRGIEEASGKETGYARGGALQLFFAPSGASERDEMVAGHRGLGFAVESLALEAARVKEPSIGPARASAFFAEESTIDPRLLMSALMEAAKGRGVEIRGDCEVNSLLLERGRCIGVRTQENMTARHVIVAAGCFSGAIDFSAGLNGNGAFTRPWAVTRPVLGQMLALKRPGFRLRRVLRSERGYLVPRVDGRIVAGSTIENTGFEKRMTAEGKRQIFSAAVELCPELETAEIVETWCGLRPGTPDALPILGPTETDGLMVATGHYRNGILLAPVTARLVREWIFTRRADFDAKAFSPLRFKDEPLATGSRRAAATQS